MVSYSLKQILTAGQAVKIEKICPSRETSFGGGKGQQCAKLFVEHACSDSQGGRSLIHKETRIKILGGSLQSDLYIIIKRCELELRLHFTQHPQEDSLVEDRCSAAGR